MALTQTKIGQPDCTGKKTVVGTWTATGVTGGDINTGLRRVEAFFLTHTGTAVEAAAAVVNESFPLEGGDVTFVCTSGDTGVWMAIGE